MAVNKVEYGDDTLIDLTEDTVTANNLLTGATAHNKAGNVVYGMVPPMVVDSAMSMTSTNPVENQVISNAVTRAGMLGSEGTFGVTALLAALEYELSTFACELFAESTDIDQTKYDGAYVVEHYFNAEWHIIDKTDSGTKTVCSVVVPCSISPTKAWALVDYDGAGSVTIQFSEDDGDEWVTLQNNTLTSLAAHLGTNLRLRLVLNGVVRVKNVAWGCK